MMGCSSTCKMGRSARVVKKFQCTPYSVTCSYTKLRQGMDESTDVLLTGYSVPLTETVRNKPNSSTGKHFLSTIVNFGSKGSRRCAGFFTRGIADTMP